MFGIVVELVISWLLLRFIGKTQLAVLGFKPDKKRARDVSMGFVIAAFCCTLYQVANTVFAGNSWALNTNSSMQGILASCWWTLKSVLFEELIFRGALLYLAIKQFGIAKACLLSAVCFGIYHWFSYNSFGNPVQMLIVFCMTGLFGWALAFAFAKTQSLYLPIGLHFGWNVFNIVVFSNGPLDAQLLVSTKENHLHGILSLLVFLFQVLALPFFTYLYVRHMFKAKSEQHYQAVRHVEKWLQ